MATANGERDASERSPQTDEKQAFFIESVSDERAYFGTYMIK